MKKILFSLILLIVASGIKAQMSEGQSNGVHFLYYLPGNYRSTGTGHPLIISLAGIGEQGDGSSADLQNLYVGGVPLVIKNGSNMVFSYTNGGTTTTDGFVVIAPQLPKGDGWTNSYVDEVMQYATSHFNIDANRIFLTGYSLGGAGTWNYATSSPNVNKLAGIVPISSNSPSSNYCNASQAQVAVYMFYGQLDDTYGRGTADALIAGYNSSGGCASPVIPAYDTVYANEVHGADFWNNKVYNTGETYQYPNAFQWMLRIRRGLAAGNAGPVAAATLNGQTNLTLQAPVKFKNLGVLDGSNSTDPDDLIVFYRWAQLAGPTVYLGSTNQPSTANRPTTVITDPASSFAVKAGDYQFQLTVKDYLTSIPNHTKSAVVNLHVVYPDGVHSAPAVEAGGSRTIITTTDRQVGDAYFYSCPNCNAKNYQWSLVSQPAGANAQLRDYNDNTKVYSPGETQAAFTNMTVNGTYQFQYAVTSQNNDVGTDILTLIKSSSLPVTYSYFNGLNNGAKNTLTWATTAEVNSDHFDVQRSTDGANFATIGNVSSRGGAVLTNYTFDDVNVPVGAAYYRLSQVDKDGKSALSKTILINSRKAGIFVDRYPNPVHDNLTVAIQSNVNGQVQVLVADMQGKTIMQQHWQKDVPSLRKTLNVGSLQKGMYQIIITAGQEKQVTSFVKY